MDNILSDFEIEQLLEKGFILKEEFLSQEELKELENEIQRLKNFNAFDRASIGKETSKRVNENIRSDSLSWVNDFNKLDSLKRYKEKIDKLGNEIKRNFFLSIRSFEAHFSFYSRGEFYLKHIDQHQASKHRQVTVVLYLSTLDSSEGGELVLYHKDDKNLVLDQIGPSRGRLVVFFSSWLYHEVKPSLNDRYSLTGWLRDDDELGIT